MKLWDPCHGLYRRGLIHTDHLRVSKAGNLPIVGRPIPTLV